MEDTFTVVVNRHKRNTENGDKELDAAGNPVIEREIGTFVFRVPTVFDELQNATKRQQLLAQVGNPDFVTPDLFFAADAHAVLLRQVSKAPEGWDLQKLYSSTDMTEIYLAYKEGLEALRKKNENLR